MDETEPGTTGFTVGVAAAAAVLVDLIVAGVVWGRPHCGEAASWARPALLAGLATLAAGLGVAAAAVRARRLRTPAARAGAPGPAPRPWWPALTLAAVLLLVCGAAVALVDVMPAACP